MRILLLAVGRERPGPTADLVETYLKRCPWRVELVDIPQRSQGPRQRRLAEEAEKIRNSLPANTAIMVLDERGDNLSSREFAGEIERFRENGRPALAFIIGGADGVDSGLVEAADRRMAFGRAVWPHRLVKVMLAEQIYRASTMSTGHPYHRD